MYIPKYDTKNLTLKKIRLVVEMFETLDTQLNELTYQNSIKVPKVVKPKNKKTLL